MSDILAGAVAEYMRFHAGLQQNKGKIAYARELHEAGILELNIDGIYPLPEFEPENDVGYGDNQKMLDYVTSLRSGKGNIF
jgi:hypothetical protein